jgi:hypothetical protein
VNIDNQWSGSVTGHVANQNEVVVNVNMAVAGPKERFDAAVKVIHSLPKNGNCICVN